ncbi:unnamed protein product [Durusdinium trenchii]|uniref:Uncharacterized protein n=1 Tax=Durusdinium trenchii TaxID=1381693 RepID=A0ABP0NC76_9DINO
MADADPFSGWTVTERSRISKVHSKSVLRRAGANVAGPVRSDGGDEHPQPSPPGRRPPSDGGYAAFKARFDREYQQQERAQSMAICRRQRQVLEALQDDRPTWEPRLARAAKAEAEEFFRLMRTASEQQASCASLMARKPRPTEPCEEPQEELPVVPRSWAEQQARACALAEPRRRASAPADTGRSTPPRNSSQRRMLAAEQQRRVAALAQPRMPKSDWMEDLWPRGLWRDELMSKAAALVPEEVQAARLLLEKMRRRPRSGKAARSEAPSARPEVQEERLRLKEVVEEVLWVALLQVRSCPKQGGLQERLGSLLISTIGPALRPVARRLLAPGQVLPRRLRAEFPKLARHLCFRDSEDMEVPVSSWQDEDLAMHLRYARECRDTMLAMDLTKDAVARLVEGNREFGLQPAEG